MAKSPLELYQQAFQLQGEQQIQEAAVLYKEIIKQFPGANESAYAAVQLEKIMADDVAEGVGRRSGAGGRLFAVIAVLLLLALGGMQYYLYNRLTRQVSDLELTVRSMAEALRQTQRGAAAPAEQPSSFARPPANAPRGGRAKPVAHDGAPSAY
jgi:hypothetical protein